MPNTSLDDLSPDTRDLAEQSFAWSEPRWDTDKALLGSRPSGSGDPGSLMVRNSVWTAVGFLLRNTEGDTEKASRTIEAIIDQQLDEPGMPYHGTYYRYVGEPHPPGKDAVMWKDYDPNWRQFIGLGLATILEEYEDRLSSDLIARMDRSLELAVVGEAPDRCPPTYSNIALMKTAMNVWVGKRLGRPEMIEYGESFGAEVHRLFKENDAFAEYNSPTYYGVNLYALGFWRRYLSDSSVHTLGRDLEEGLWRDIARYYHAGLKNLCGPFSRSYGMDMTQHTALVSLHIWMAYGKPRTPFPEDGKINSEFAYGPCFAIYDAAPPEDIASVFESFEGPRTIKRGITTEPRRTATAVIEEDLMLGAESTGEYSARSYQHHPITAHWRSHNGEVAWLRLKHIGPIDARAEKGRVTCTAPISDAFTGRDGDSTTFTFVVCAPDISEATFQTDTWRLSGMTVAVETNLSEPRITQERDTFEVTYTATDDTASFTLDFKRA
jgi:hypothetical protein